MEHKHTTSFINPFLCLLCGAVKTQSGKWIAPPKEESEK